MTESGRVVVAGAGLAGFRTVDVLRERGFAGPITLIGADPRPPPPLARHRSSKTQSPRLTASGTNR